MTHVEKVSSLIFSSNTRQPGDMLISSFTEVISQLIFVIYTFHIYNEMMGVILLTVELISLGSTGYTRSPHYDHGGTYTTLRHSKDNPYRPFRKLNFVISIEKL